MSCNKNSFIIKGDIAYSISPTELGTLDNGYVVCAEEICKGVYQEIPAEYENLPVLDHSGSMIIPGITDLHVHAPQYTFRGNGYDLELLDWLNTYTFPEESHYADLEYAKKAYSYFVEDLKRSFTSRAVIFATVHTPATIVLMEQLEETGLVTYVGKVNMDRNSTADLDEGTAEASMEQTRLWLDQIAGRFTRTMPIITPRFIPSCSDELMQMLGNLAKENKLRIQSHLSENPSEIAWVKELVPAADCYANAYEIFDNMGTPDCPTIMAHCVYSDQREIDIMKKHGVYVAHCPSSNMNITSGIAPIRTFMEQGLNIGLASDVAGGSNLNMLQVLLLSIQASKMYYRLVDQNVKALTFEEAFYLATEGGGRYFGQVGSFKKGYEFDAVVLDDSKMHSMRKLTVRDRIERACYNDADVKILEKYVDGNLVYTTKHQD